MMIGIVGTGSWGSRVVSELKLMKYVQILAYDENPNPDLEIEYVDTFEALMRRCMAIIVATPNESHFGYAKQCLESGVPVFIEKPITTTSSDAEKLMKLSMQGNVLLAVGHIYRYNEIVKDLKKFVDRQDKVYYAKFEWGKDGVFEGRDLMFDLLPHIIDIMFLLFGEDVKLGSVVEGDAVVSALLTCGGVPCEIHIDWRNPVKTRRVTIVGDKGSISASVVSQKAMYYPLGYPNDATSCPVGGMANNTIKDEFEAFINAVKTRTQIHNSGYEGWKTVQLIEEMKRCVSR